MSTSPSRSQSAQPESVASAQFVGIAVGCTVVVDVVVVGSGVTTTSSRQHSTPSIPELRYISAHAPKLIGANEYVSACVQSAPLQEAPVGQELPQQTASLPQEDVRQPLSSAYVQPLALLELAVWLMAIAKLSGWAEHASAVTLSRTSARVLHRCQPSAHASASATHAPRIRKLLGIRV